MAVPSFQRVTSAIPTSLTIMCVACLAHMWRFRFRCSSFHIYQIQPCHMFVQMHHQCLMPAERRSTSIRYAMCNHAAVRSTACTRALYPRCASPAQPSYAPGSVCVIHCFTLLDCRSAGALTSTRMCRLVRNMHIYAWLSQGHMLSACTSTCMQSGFSTSAMLRSCKSRIQLCCGHMSIVQMLSAPG